MSDDTTDDRMSRAERIRRKRENRSTANETEEEQESASTDDAETDGSAEGDDASEGSEEIGDSEDDASRDSEETEASEDGASDERDDATAGDDEEVDAGDEGDAVERSEDTSADDPGDDDSDGEADAPDPDEESEAPDPDDPDRPPAADDPTVTGEPTAVGGGGVTATAVEQAPGAQSAGAAETEGVSGGVTATAVGVDAESAVGTEGEASTHRIASIVSGDTIAGDEFFAGDAAERAQVLEFDLGDETFAIDVGYVDEIVETPEIARMPNTPDPVRGVVDLRGKVTAVVDPSAAIAAAADPDGEDLVIVLDSAELDYGGTAGWLVDDVNRVRTVAAADVSAPPAEEDAAWVRGIIEGEDEGLTMWTAPEAVLDAVDDGGAVDADPADED